MEDRSGRATERGAELEEGRKETEEGGSLGNGGGVERRA